jgi:hypothetical protein
MRRIVPILIILFAACGGEAPKVNDSRSAINLDVTMLDAGAEPRQELRYQRAAGRNERLLLRLSLANLLETRVGSAVAVTPVLDLVLGVGPTYQAKEAGVWGYPIHFELIGVHDTDGLSTDERNALVEELTPVAHAQGTFEIDERGITRNAQVTIPPDMSPRLVSLLGNIRTTLVSSALPKEAIGIGARWQTDRIVKVGELSVPQTVVYTLLGREGDLLRIGVSLRQSATPQQFTLGEHGAVFKLEAYEGSAVGTVLVDLHGFVPLTDVHGQSQMRATVQRGDQSEPMSVSGDVSIQIAPLPADAPAASADASKP